MSTWNRSASLGVILLACASLMSGTAAAAPLADNANASPRLKYLPKDYWLVAECDLGTIAKLMAAAQDNPQMAQLKQYLALAKQFTAIDLEKDVDAVTLFVAGTPDEPKMLVVVQGSFKNEAVAKRLSASLEGSITEKKYKKQSIYSFLHYDLAFPEDSTILVGEEGLVRGGIDQGAAAKPRQLPESLKAVLDRTPGKSVMWTAFRPQVLLEHDDLADWRKNNGELHRSLKKIDCLSVFFSMANDGVLIKGIGYVSTPEGATSLHKYLSDRKKNVLHEEGSNVLFTTLLILSDVKVEGSYVDGSFRLTGEAFKELWDTKLIVRPGKGSGNSTEK